MKAKKNVIQKLESKVILNRRTVPGWEKMFDKILIILGISTEKVSLWYKKRTSYEDKGSDVLSRYENSKRVGKQSSK